MSPEEIEDMTDKVLRRLAAIVSSLYQDAEERKRALTLGELRKLIAYALQEENEKAPMD